MLTVSARKLDPTRTTMLVRQWMGDMQRRFASVRKANRELLVEDDALGLTAPGPFIIQQQVGYQAWRFQTDANKIQSYRKWLKAQVDAKILTVDVTGKPWMATYVESAYRKGVANAYMATHKKSVKAKPGFYEGTREQFLREAFAQPELLSKVELLYTRAFTELVGVTATMDQQLSRILAMGIVNGIGPKKLAAEMASKINTLSRNRAMLIARTETIYAHAEGQLDSFEMLGVTEVGLEAEWSTVLDKKVCPECEAMEGVVMPVDKAHGLIPRHPACRCSWLPALASRKETGQLWGRSGRSAIRKSIGAEYASGSYRQAKMKSVWSGKELV